MQIEIQDDFDLKKISISGQCFRAKCLEDERYRFINGDKVIYIQKAEGQKFSVSGTMEEWEELWTPYFDLGRCYRDIFNKECDKHPFVQKAMLCGQGLRILRQDPWEMLITFILSQRKNIPAISKSVEMLAERYGHCIETEYETLYSFPSLQELSSASVDELKECSLGYRAQYVFDAIQQVRTGNLNLDALFGFDDEKLLAELQKVHGVGKKVANCIALFAYGRMACVPIDVWISRAIEDDCKGESPFPLFRENAGIIQQYVFYYEKHHLSEN